MKANTERVFQQEHLPEYHKGIPESIRKQREYWTPFCGFSQIMVVGPTTGQEAIYHSNFFHEVDPDWANYGFQTPSRIPTPKPQRVVVLAQKKDGSFPEMIRAISGIERRVLRQEHMDSFCRKYPELIPEVTSIFFPIVHGLEVKSDLSNVFFGNAFRKNGRVLSNIRRPSDDTVFLAEEGDRRIVIFHS